MNKIEKFLKELRDAGDIIYIVFTEGSCFRLYSILNELFENAVPYWSDIDNHCIVKVDDSFYDIGGKVSKNYIRDRGYYELREEQYEGYYLLKYSNEDRRIQVEKYVGNGKGE